MKFLDYHRQNSWISTNNKNIEGEKDEQREQIKFKRKN